MPLKPYTWDTIPPTMRTYLALNQPIADKFFALSRKDQDNMIPMLESSARSTTLVDSEKRKPLDSTHTTEQLCKQYNLVHIREYKSLYRYENGIYVPDPHFVTRVCMEDPVIRKFRATQSKRNDIFDQIRSVTDRRYDNFDSNPNIINTLAGLVDISKTPYVMSEHTPDHLSLIQLAHYPEDTSTDIPDLLVSWVGTDYANVLMFLHLMMLDTKLRNRYQDSLWFLIGPGGTGKSTFMQLSSEMMRVAGKNVDRPSLTTSLNMDILNGQKSMERSVLAWSVANLCDEVSSIDLLEMSTLRWMTGGAPISIHQKYKDPIQVTLSLVLLFAANRAPTILEHKEDAVMRRLVIIPFMNVHRLEKGTSQKIKTRIKDNSNIHGYMHYLLSNKNDIMKLALATIPDRSDARRMYYEVRGLIDPFREEIVTTEDVSEVVSFGKLYESYCEWCMNRFAEPIGIDNFRYIIGKKHKIVNDNTTGTMREVIPSVKLPEDTFDGAKAVEAFLREYYTKTELGSIPMSGIIQDWIEYAKKNSIEYPTKHRIQTALRGMRRQIKQEGGEYYLEGYQER